MKQVITPIILIAAMQTACVNDGLGPQRGPLRFEAAIGRSTLGVGDTTSIVFRLRNLSSDSIVLKFNDSCQILPYVTTHQADQVVHPSGGEWGCYGALTSLALAPGAAETVTVLVRGGAQATYPAIALLPGEYRAFARLQHPEFPLSSRTLDFRIE